MEKNVTKNNQTRWDIFYTYTILTQTPNEAVKIMTFASISYSFCMIRCTAIYTNIAVKNQMTRTDSTAPRISVEWK